MALIFVTVTNIKSPSWKTVPIPQSLVFSSITDTKAIAPAKLIYLALNPA